MSYYVMWIVLHNSDLNLCLSLKNTTFFYLIVSFNNHNYIYFFTINLYLF